MPLATEAAFTHAPTRHRSAPPVMVIGAMVALTVNWAYSKPRGVLPKLS